MRLLFATDLSEPRETIRTVEDFADRLEADLYVLHVHGPIPAAPIPPVDPMSGVMGFAPYTVFDPEIEETLEEAEEDAFRRFLARHFKRPVRPASRVGDAAEMILKDAEDEQVDVIILGRRHRSKLERLLEGSVAGGVLRHATVPVILIPILDEESATAAR